MKEMKALLFKYNVSFHREKVYYPGDPSTITLSINPIEKGSTYITIEDIADLNGGMKRY